MKPCIRKATRADIPSLTLLIRTAFSDVAERFGLTPENCPKHPSNHTDARTKAELERGVCYYLLIYGTEPVGCVGLELAEKGICYLERLAVMPRYRKKGYGKELVEKSIKEAGKMNADAISIGIIADQLELKFWYHRLGFKEGETRSFPHLPFRATFMRYDLA